jgi:hypothetical protein
MFPPMCSTFCFARTFPKQKSGEPLTLVQTWAAGLKK